MRMPSAIYSAVALTVVAASLVMMMSHRRSPARAPVQVGETEYEVLSAWLNDTFTGQKAEQRVGKGIARIVIADMSQFDDHTQVDENGKPIPWEKTAKLLQENAATLQRTTIDAFRGANARSAAFRPSFHLAVKYELIDLDQLVSIPKGGDWWGEYYKRFPGSQGVMTLSRVGLSADSTQALLFLNNTCGGLCSTGMYVVMEKRDGHWVIGKEIEVWIS
jgi:hypothetical protein